MYNKHQHITGIILAGGQSRRMGQDKGVMEIGGKTLVEHAIETLKPLVGRTMIIANHEQYQRFGVAVFPDLIPDQGPLGGIYTGLHHSATNLNIILPCDMPRISANLLTLLLDAIGEHDICIPHWEGSVQPLVGVYHKRCEPKMGTLLEDGELKMQEVIKHFNSQLVAITADHFLQELSANINTPKDLEQK